MGDRNLIFQKVSKEIEIMFKRICGGVWMVGFGEEDLDLDF